MKPEKSPWGVNKRLSELKGEPVSIPAGLPHQGRDDAHDRHPCFTVRLVMESGDEWSVLYGSLVGAPAYNPSHGIAFVFDGLHPTGWGKWEDARWLVTIRGSNLGPIYHHLCLSQQRFIRIGANGDGPGEGDIPRQADGPEVTAITVEKVAQKH